MRRVFLFLALQTLFFSGFLNAQSGSLSNETRQSISNKTLPDKVAGIGNHLAKASPTSSATRRVDLRTRTLVSKKLNQVLNRADG
ncbi:MAG: hypothetical protein LBJ00_14750, partial [Planctomycetaceae bacterium]|nr:hypothetical protein [Planctomycetaceae bacterium]